jgi:hypothetical protein
VQLTADLVPAEEQHGGKSGSEEDGEDALGGERNPSMITSSRPRPMLTGRER